MLSNLLSKFMSSEFWREVKHQNSILRRWGYLHFQKRFLNSQLLWRLWCLKGKGASFASLSTDGQQQFCEVSIGIISVLELRKWEFRGFKEFMKNLHNPSWWVEFEAMSPECKPMSFSTTAGSVPIFRRITSLWTTANHPTLCGTEEGVVMNEPSKPLWPVAIPTGVWCRWMVCHRKERKLKKNLLCPPVSYNQVGKITLNQI